MKKSQKTAWVKTVPSTERLFERVVAILEKARANVVRSVNNNMVIAYWLIGREIVQELQRGEVRAGYGERLLEGLSERLVRRYGQGYSVPNLRNFRQFYLTFKDRSPEIRYPVGSELGGTENRYPQGSESPSGFHPNLSWSHYRALTRVENTNTRDFYETESVLVAL